MSGFEQFLKELHRGTSNVRQASYTFEDEFIEYLEIDIDTLESMTINEIKIALINKRDGK